VISRNEYPIGVVRAGCDARRDECRVASHTNEEQRSSAPDCAAKMGYPFLEITLRELMTRPNLVISVIPFLFHVMTAVIVGFSTSLLEV